jgi:hypothetical protein
MAKFYFKVSSCNPGRHRLLPLPPHLRAVAEVHHAFDVCPLAGRHREVLGSVDDLQGTGFHLFFRALPIVGHAGRLVVWEE